MPSNTIEKVQATALKKYKTFFKEIKEKRVRIEELRTKYPQTEFLIFKSQKDADLFLRQRLPRRSTPEKGRRNVG